MQEILEGLAEKILADALENIRRLGFNVLVRDGYNITKVQDKNTFIVSDERYRRGDYE